MKFYLTSFVLLSALVAQDKTIHLKKGQLLDLVAAHYHNAESQQKSGPAYLSKVFPLAQKHGFTPQITFNTVNFKEAHFSAGGFGLYSWPSVQHLQTFAEEKTWPALKASRPNYWKNLRINHFEVKEDMTLNFKKNKVYRITYIWLFGYQDDDQNLEAYLNPMKKVIERLGGKYILSFKNGGINFESLNNDRTPNRVAITEWPDEKTHQLYLKSPEFKKNKQHFFSAVAEFEAFNVKANL